QGAAPGVSRRSWGLLPLPGTCPADCAVVPASLLLGGLLTVIAKARRETRGPAANRCEAGVSSGQRIPRPLSPPDRGILMFRPIPLPLSRAAVRPFLPRRASD